MATSWLAAERSGISGVDGTGETGTLPARGAAGAGLPARRAPDHRRYSRAGGLRLRGDRRPPARSGAPAGRGGTLRDGALDLRRRRGARPHACRAAQRALDRGGAPGGQPPRRADPAAHPPDRRRLVRRRGGRRRPHRGPAREVERARVKAASGRPVGTDRGREEDRELLRRYHEAGDTGARERLIERHLPLVRSLARRYAGRGEALEDIEQVGAIGLIKAIDRFELEREVSLATYATPNVVGEIKRHFRDKGWAIRVPRALQELNASMSTAIERLTVSLSTGPTGDEELDPLETIGVEDEGFERSEDRAALVPALRRLPPREREILRMRFEEGLPQTQIAHRIGLSQMHVSRLIRKSLAAMREQLGGRGSSGNAG